MRHLTSLCVLGLTLVCCLAIWSHQGQLSARQKATDDQRVTVPGTYLRAFLVVSKYHKYKSVTRAENLGRYSVGFSQDNKSYFVRFAPKRNVAQQGGRIIYVVRKSDFRVTETVVFQ